MVSSECLPVSGSMALTSNWLRPRRRSTRRRPQPGRLGRDLVGVAVRRPVVDVDGRVRQGDAAEGVRGRRIVDLDHRRRRVRDRDRGRLREAQELDAEVGPEGEHADGHQRQDDDERREGQALPWRRQRARHRDGRGHFLGLAALAPPLLEDLVGVEAEVERVVAQEALRVDRAGELLPVAALHRVEVARPDLRVALGAVQVDALALARLVEALRQARGGVWGRLGRIGAVTRRRPPRSVLCRHRWSVGVDREAAVRVRLRPVSIPQASRRAG